MVTASISLLGIGLFRFSSFASHFVTDVTNYTFIYCKPINIDLKLPSYVCVLNMAIENKKQKKKKEKAERQIKIIIILIFMFVYYSPFPKGSVFLLGFKLFSSTFSLQLGHSLALLIGQV